MSARAPPMHQINGRRLNYQRNAGTAEQEVLKYIQDSWKNVCEKVEVTKVLPEGKAPAVSFYKDGLSDDHTPRPDFKPFDLDSFIEKRTTHQNSNRKLTQ